MPYSRHLAPHNRLHRASGQAIVTIAGRDHYLGPRKSKANIVAQAKCIYSVQTAFVLQVGSSRTRSEIGENTAVASRKEHASSGEARVPLF